MSAIAVACCQLAPVLGDPAANRELAAAAVTDAARQGAAVVVLPELMSSGYVFASRQEARAAAEPSDGATIALWTQLAADLGVVMVGGFAELASGAGLPRDTVFNSAALVDATGLRCVYRKTHLWDAEPSWFAAGAEPPPVIDTPVGRIGVVVCYDLEFPEWTRLPALDGAQLLCAPVNWPAYPRPAGRPPSEIIKAQACAAVNRMFVAVCDRAGDERGVSWTGGSMIADPDGWLLGGGGATDAQQLLLAECDLSAAADKSVSGNNDVLRDRRPQLYGRLAQT
jgi:predicted amidohydrolase